MNTITDLVEMVNRVGKVIGKYRPKPPIPPASPKEKNLFQEFLYSKLTINELALKYELKNAKVTYLLHFFWARSLDYFGDFYVSEFESEKEWQKRRNLLILKFPSLYLYNFQKITHCRKCPEFWWKLSEDALIIPEIFYEIEKKHLDPGCVVRQLKSIFEQ